MFKHCLLLVTLALWLACLSAQADPAAGSGPVENAADSLEQAVTESNNADPQFVAADQALFIIPTAYTMPKGKSAITDFELLILQYTYAPVEHLHISAGMAFPIVSELIRSLTIGAKFNYFHQGNVQAAVFGSYSPHPDIRAANIGHVLSIGKPGGSVHFAVTKPFGEIEDIGKGGVVAALGGIADLGPRVAGIGELYLYLSKDEPLKAFNLGLRFKGKNISWDLGGMRPIGIDTGGFIAFPFVKATFIF